MKIDPLYIWYGILILAFSILASTCLAINFPVTQMGNCNEGVQIMEKFYDANGIATTILQMDFISNQYPGHLWMQVGPDRQIVDPYYGPISYEGQYGFNRWFSPDRTFKSFQELQEWRIGEL